MSMKHTLLNPMTKTEWDAACTVRECRWSDNVWRDSKVIGHESGRYRVKTPDGADRPARGETPAEAIASVSYAYDYFAEEVWSKETK